MTAPATFSETVGRNGGKGQRPATHEEHHGVLQNDRYAERAEHRRQTRRAPQRSVGRRLDADAEEPDRDESRHEDAKRDQDADGAARKAGRRRKQEEGKMATDHEHLAVGEVDEAQNAVDHRVAQRDQRVDGADRKGVDQLLNEKSGHEELAASKAASRAARRTHPAPLGPRCAVQLFGHSRTKSLPFTL